MVSPGDQGEPDWRLATRDKRASEAPEEREARLPERTYDGALIPYISAIP